MKCFFVINFILFEQFVLSQSKVFENDIYKFVINEDLYELYTVTDVENDYNHIPRRSKCYLVSKGTITKDSEPFYYLNSNFYNDFQLVEKQKYYTPELKDEYFISIKIENFRKIDFENFYLLGNYDKINNILERDDGVIVSYKLNSYNHKIVFQLHANNSKYLLSDYPRLDTYFPLLEYEIEDENVNSFFFEIQDFNPCYLYHYHFDKEYVKIIGDKLYYKDYILIEQK